MNQDPNTPAEKPATRMQALAEFWAALRARVATWWAAFPPLSEAFSIRSSAVIRFLDSWKFTWLIGAIVAMVIIFQAVVIQKMAARQAAVVPPVCECLEEPEQAQEVQEYAWPYAAEPTRQAPARRATPRAAQVPAQSVQEQPEADQEQVQESTWGETELDRELDEFTRRLYQQEPTK